MALGAGVIALFVTLLGGGMRGHGMGGWAATTVEAVEARAAVSVDSAVAVAALAAAVRRGGGDHENPTHPEALADHTWSGHSVLSPAAL
jgi:hypothetical protein